MEVAELQSLLERFTNSCYRLETLQAYDIPAEQARIAAFNRGDPIEPRPASSNHVVREAVAAGKTVERGRLIRWPLTDYLRYELHCYETENVPAGERIYVASVDEFAELDRLPSDHLLFDGETDHPVLVWVRYDPVGRHVGWERDDDPAAIAAAVAAMHLMLDRATPLHLWLDLHHDRSA